MKNNTQLVPHTDTRRKILSMMLYFPQEYLTEEQKKNLLVLYFIILIKNLEEKVGIKKVI